MALEAQMNGKNERSDSLWRASPPGPGRQALDREHYPMSQPLLKPGKNGLADETLGRVGAGAAVLNDGDGFIFDQPALTKARVQAFRSSTNCRYCARLSPSSWIRRI
jgi:hypothetical protein